MIYRVVLSDTANRDLRQIFEYIYYELKVPRSAVGILNKLEESISSLEEMPNRYKVIVRKSLQKSLQSQKIRSMPVGNYVVIYIVEEKESVVNIMRVIYGGRDIDTELKYMDE